MWRRPGVRRPVWNGRGKQAGSSGGFPLRVRDSTRPRGLRPVEGRDPHPDRSPGLPRRGHSRDDGVASRPRLRARSTARSGAGGDRGSRVGSWTTPAATATASRRPSPPGSRSGRCRSPHSRRGGLRRGRGRRRVRSACGRSAEGRCRSRLPPVVVTRPRRTTVGDGRSCSRYGLRSRQGSR
jgi:hypothetical protein